MLRVFSDKGKGKRSSSEASTEEVEEDTSLRATKSFSLRKRKLDEHESQNPNHVASSSSSYDVASKRRFVVPNEPVREIEPVREREAPVGKRKPVRREVVVREKPERTPEWLVNLMREENGFDAKLIIEKELTATDVSKHQNRLLIPLNMIVEEDFLNGGEMRIIMEHHLKRREKGVDVIFVGFKGQKCELNFRRWDMKSSANYVLISGWHNAAVNNRLRPGQIIRLWSFHSPQKLYFALAPPDPAPAMALALAPPPVSDPAPAMAVDLAQPPVPALVPAPTQAQASALALALASSSVNFPKRKRKTRSRRVWVPPPDLASRDRDHDGQSRHEDSDLYILAMYCD